MSDIPATYQRIREHRVESIVARYLSEREPIAKWLFERSFATTMFSEIVSVALHIDRDHRRSSGDPLAYGETDIEVIARVAAESATLRVAMLIEMKVDARQMENQGPRYRARARHRQKAGHWDEFRCLLMAPRRYLENAYPLGDYREAGWDHLVSLEELGEQLKRTAIGAADAAVILQSTEVMNSWNKPIPEAAQFWSDLALFQRAVFPDVPIFINRQQGAGVFVWPSFYENQLAKNPREIRRKRVQIVHSGKTHVALFIKNVKASPFSEVVQPLLEDAIHLGDPGGAWQSVRISVPYVDPQVAVEKQIEALSKVFEAARRLYDFFLKHEQALLKITTFK